MEQRFQKDEPTRAARSRTSEPAAEPGFEGRAALVIAHPGHELCVHGWLGRARPDVFILTDGSGRQGTPRLPSTLKILSATGARPGSLFGRLVDQSIYQALLRRDAGFFTELASELAEALVRGRYSYVVGDALEGYNPTHDICRVVLDTAVELASLKDPSRRIANFDFPIMSAGATGARQPGVIRLRLDESAFRRKLEAMRACPELADEVSAGLDGTDLRVLDFLGELAGEIKDLLAARGGADSFRVECLRPVALKPASALSRPPFYERYGEKLVSLGLYREAIRDFAAAEADFAVARSEEQFAAVGA